MSHGSSFGDIADRLQAGDEKAAAEVFERYADRLIRLARSRLDVRVRQKLDPEDVMQSVFRSFFLRQAAGRFTLDGWDSVWALLVRITLRKCGRRVAFFRTQGRDVALEFRPNIADDDSRHEWEALSREPTPDEIVALTETVEQLLKGLDPRQQQMVCMRLQLYTVAEISAETGCTERTVFRVLARVRDVLASTEDSDPDRTQA